MQPWAMTPVSTLGSAALDLLLAPSCAGCGASPSDGPVCRACRSRLDPRPQPVVPLHPPPGLPLTLAAMPYSDVVRRLLVAHKEHARLSLARPLGLLLAAAVAAALDDPASPVVLVPIPSMRGTTRSRGHDPVRRMAHAAVVSLGGGARLAPVLRHRRRVGDQSELSVEQRRVNLSHALEARGPIPSGDVAVVLVDDICSSGATVAAGAQALLARGVPGSVLRGAVVASPPLHARRPVGQVGTTSP